MKLLTKIIPVILLFYAVYAFLTNWTFYAFSRFRIFIFDSTLRLLPHFYIKSGLIPYKDFGIVYPPGLFLLIGKLVPFVSIEQRNLILAIITLCLTIISCVFLYALNPKNRLNVFIIALFIFINTFLLEELIWSETLSRLFITLLLFFWLLYVRRQNRLYLFLSLIMPTAIIFLRWTSIIGIVGIQIAGLATISVIALFKKHPLPNLIRRHWVFIIFEVIGTLVGFGLLFAYLMSIGALREGIDFIFNIPLNVILEYRKLPLPSLNDYPTGVIFYSSVSALCLEVFWAVIPGGRLKQDQQLTLILVSLVPLALIPYATGRADMAHIMTLYYYIGLTLLIMSAISPKMRKMLILSIFLIVVAFRYIKPVGLVLPPQQSLLQKDLTENLSDCKRQTSFLKYNSLFVGRVSYGRFVISTAALYLVNPEVRPATAFISDEPGLQNSLYYGTIIANQLTIAPKPMLALLELKQQYPEQNKTQSMKSAGRIEEFLSKNRHKTYSICQAYDKLFLIRLYQ